MTLPTTSPTAFCKAYIQRELESYQQDKIWMSSWPTMQLIIERAEELKKPFEELINKYGYLDKKHHSQNRHHVFLILEHIWSSHEFAMDTIQELKDQSAKLDAVTKKIVTLCGELAKCYEIQTSLLNEAGYQRGSYQDALSALQDAGENIPLFGKYIAPELSKLAGRFDGKYWPSKIHLLKAFEAYEEDDGEFSHYYFPSKVLSSRTSVVKNFVACFDARFEDHSRQLPNDFRFSNAALADILNVVLDIEVDNLYSDEAIKNARRKIKNETRM
ncbi:hypothetical protein [Brumicola blandensis]|uniref:Uncharacterized protein n=1 Tax=Brumicola blandensis TaxID=3075611 RepID=A0AAW8QWZ8_9ALTE|nr:hypothetical protein [Alteromonas sp. W409]MDT0581506.1 hypothetical protein [Alteromonas sp. W409]